MTTAVIVQARLGSTRLPAKVLLPLPTGRTVLEEVLYRCKQIAGVDVVVCAIPDTADNDILVPFIRDADQRQIVRASREDRGVRLTVCQEPRPSIKIVRGPEHDVLARYAKAAEEVGADIIMRVTADCPLIDPQVCCRTLAMVDRHDGHKLVYACNNEPRTFPHGLDCEVFSRALLEAADDGATDAYDREHVGPWMRRNAANKHFLFNETDQSHLRWTLDRQDEEQGDYVAIWNVFKQQMAEAA